MLLVTIFDDIGNATLHVEIRSFMMCDRVPYKVWYSFARFVLYAFTLLI